MRKTFLFSFLLLLTLRLPLAYRDFQDIAKTLSISETIGVSDDYSTKSATSMEQRLAESAADSLSLSVPTDPHLTDSNIDIELHVTGAVDLAGYEFDLVYDQSFLEFVAVSHENFLGDLNGCIPALARCAAGLGPITRSGASGVGAYSYGAGATANGDGLLAIITFKPTGLAGTSQLQLANVIVSDSAASSI